MLTVSYYLSYELMSSILLGMMFTSKCYQCCNSGFNCNANWLPASEFDWSFNDIRGHRYNEVTDPVLMRPDELASSVESDDTTGTFMTHLQDAT